MVSGAHLDLDQLLSIAEGELSAARAAGAHLAGCPACQAELARLRSFVAAVGEELLETRPGCMTPDEIATLAPGAEADHPHLADCPLCREEWQALLAFEAARTLAAHTGPFVRPQLFERGGRELYAARGAFEVDLREGAERAGTVASAKVSLRVAAGEILLRVEGTPTNPLRLLLESDLLEKRLDLAPGELRLPLAGWKRAKVEAR